MTTDLTQAALDVVAGRERASLALDRALACAAGVANLHTFVRRFDASARATAKAVDLLREALCAL